jgi:hypothetical protein
MATAWDKWLGSTRPVPTLPPLARSFVTQNDLHSNLNRMINELNENEKRKLRFEPQDSALPSRSRPAGAHDLIEEARAKACNH